MSIPAVADNKAQPATVALFVSDLHLSPHMPKTAAAFFRFLDEVAINTRQLYLLGDIFEYWAGDDDIDDPFNRKVADALRRLTDKGVKLFWIAGNRDFLAGEGFAQATGVSLATARASHLMPWRPNFTCARASSPAPSMASTVPSPNLLWNTCMPLRRPCEGAAFCGGTGGEANWPGARSRG